MMYSKNGVATLSYPSSHRVTPPLNILTSLDMMDRTDVTESAAKQTRKQLGKVTNNSTSVFSEFSIILHKICFHHQRNGPLLDIKIHTEGTSPPR